MVRPLRSLFLLIPLTLIAGASFVCGQGLRKSVTPPRALSNLDNRVSSLPEAGIGGTSTDNADNGDNAAQPDDIAPEETFKEVLRYIKGDYVDKVDDEKKLGFGAVKSMLATLDDPKTRFLDPAQRKQLIDQINGQFTGIGATVTVVKQKKGDAKTAIDLRRLAIVAPALGGPADKAGLQPGDMITEIDGKWVIAYDPRLEIDQLIGEAPEDNKDIKKAARDAADRLTKGTALPKALELLSDNTGKTLSLTIERPGTAQPFKLSVATSPATVQPVELKTLDSRTSYLRVTQFNDRSTELFTSALSDLTRVKTPTLIVDLRGNVGGPVTGRLNGALGSTLALIGKLSGVGQVGTIMRRGGKMETLSTTVPAQSRFKLFVLINGGTANLAELAAAALKERAGATVIGSRTFGDSVYQKMIELRDGAGMTVTTGKMLTARGFDFTGRGVQPDIAIPTGGPRADDAAVQRAISSAAG